MSLRLLNTPCETHDSYYTLSKPVRTSFSSGRMILQKNFWYDVPENLLLGRSN